MFFYLIASAWMLSCTFAATTHVINVGDTGSFYDPETITAAENDVVQFVFSGNKHGVVQSSFDNPCVPLSGGFSSGIQGRGENPGADTPSPLWNLTITNVTGPIWFYCQASRPSSHCAQGMVGAINPASQAMFQQFKQAAQATLGNQTSQGPDSVVNTGQGAFATAAPSPTTIPSTVTTSGNSSTPASASSSPSSSSTSTPTASASAATSSSSNHTGAIAGGVSAAAVVIILAVILSFYLCRRKQNRTSPHTFAHAGSPPMSGKSETFPIVRQPEPNFYGPRHQTSNPSMNPYNFPPEIYSEASPPGTVASLPGQRSRENLANIQTTQASATQDRSLNALANQVAAVLMQKPAFASKNHASPRPGTGDSRTANTDSNSGILPSYTRSA
ncbi:hypothetical protein VKT23_016495 [Stygiomarasmius scandens]|uniref:Extracellular serine-rich protein n=1 Tax=Marasmiellus scandens TaxID=2682957 RepID=A0ABR1IV88_9AGAR